MSKIYTVSEYPRSPWMHFVFFIVIGALSFPLYEAYQAHTPVFIWIGIPLLFLIIVWIWMIMNPLAEIKEHYIEFFIVPFYVPRLYKNDIIHHKFSNYTLWITFKDFDQKRFTLFTFTKPYKTYISDFFNAG